MGKEFLKAVGGKKAIQYFFYYRSIKNKNVKGSLSNAPISVVKVFQKKM